MNDRNDCIQSESSEMVSQPLMAILFDLPFEADLWQFLGQKIGCSGAELLAKVQTLFDKGMIREIGPIFNPTMLGYKTTLMAASVPEDRLMEVAGIVSSHTGVSHNYLRDNPIFNLWFTLAVVGDEESLAHEIEKLSQKTGVPMRRFDTIAQYKISFRMSDEIPPEPISQGKAFSELEPAMQKRLAVAIEIFQRGLPLTQQPFEALAITAGTMGLDELLDSGNELRELGILRRFGVTWRHREIGFTQNVLCVWQIPEHQIEVFAQRTKSIGPITHCYQRTSYPDWPWSIYTMIHGHSREECEAIISQLSQEFPEAKNLAMQTVKEFKKQRIIYQPMISQ